MKNFKTIDTWISITLIPLFIIYGFITMSENSLYGYFIVGGWQVISMVVHAIKQWFTESQGQRTFYHKLILILAGVIAGLAVFAQFIEFLFVPLLLIMFLLLILSPVMAIYYTYMCYEETYVKMRRPMELLK